MLELTKREREVCDLLIEGCSNREIGLRLGIAERTVKARFKFIFLRNRLDPKRHQRVLLAGLYYQEIAGKA